LLGNVLVIGVILLHRKMRSVVNLCLANLAVADLCVGVLCVLPNLSLYMSQLWHLGRVGISICIIYGTLFQEILKNMTDRLTDIDSANFH